jgi:hypothetical protein
MIRRTLLALGILVYAAVPAAAQVLGLPVVNNGAPTGISIGADVGFSNDDAGKGTAVGAHASVGLGFIGVSGMISRFVPSGGGDAIWAPGASATLRLIGGPLVPFRITMQAGASRWTEGSTDVLHVPVSIGLSATIPNPAFGIKPWVAPRIDVINVANGGGTSANFGISGGVDLSFLNGISIRAAYDRVSSNGVHPSIFSLGLGFAP